MHFHSIFSIRWFFENTIDRILWIEYVKQFLLTIRFDMFENRPHYECSEPDQFVEHERVFTNARLHLHVLGHIC
jgi:hypothetical protein